MDRTWYTRLGIIIAVTLGTLWMLVPSYYSFFRLERADRNNIAKLQEVLPPWAPPAKYRLSLGLDLQGGIHLVMHVDMKTALTKRAERRASQMVSYVTSKKLGEIEMPTVDPENNRVTVMVKDPATAEAIQNGLLDMFKDFTLKGRDGAKIELALDESSLEGMSTEALDMALLRIRERIDKWGVSEVQIAKLGTDQIQISLPGQSDPEQVKQLIGTTAQLEFRLVANDSSIFQKIYTETPPADPALIRLVEQGTAPDSPGGPFIESENRAELIAYMANKVPAPQKVLTHCVPEAGPKRKCLKYQTYLMDSQNVPGDLLKTAWFPGSPNTQGQYYVAFEMQPEGAKQMGELTGKNVNRKMGIILDDNVMSAPNIQSEISDSGTITFGRMGPEAKDYGKLLATTLQSGALPAPVTIGEIRQVGASLGDELIKKGTLAALLGLALVVLFMAFYYRVSGLVADVALILNGGLILAGLAAFGATLTLPGIAGFVLTLGIAVDANVLINERVREELAAGKTARAAVDAGYDRAFWTIFDAHVTTLIAGFVLAFTGTGPVRGFATALIIGIIASLFTSIVVTRLITTYIVHGRNATTVSV
ncbi:MAG: protein translocase subunit SecD [Archangium sp.]|nr:protein translocase subunit SecD [Archangium sp.]MDP3151676.1 protein translocase subunit SecD [Archangium sp.]MDP3573194.1 protein translocase subunit SecD [Archangium sp.]